MRAFACDEDTRVLVSSYADGQVTPEEERQAKMHLAGCADCRARAEEWGKLGELFQWAYTQNLPEVEIIMQPVETKQPAPAGLVGALRRKLISRRRWALAGTMATLAVLAVAAGLMMRPPLLTGSLRTGANPEVVRLEGGVRLEVAPNSAVTRMGNDWVKLESGSVLASVKHGERRFRLQSPRLDTFDLGTRFRVATGPNGDVVIVKEGAVTVRHAGQDEAVRAGQTLLAMEGSQPAVLAPPSQEDGEIDQGRPIHDPAAPFEPGSLRDLDRLEREKRLAARFPGLRFANSSGGGHRTSEGLVYSAQLDSALGLRVGLRKHFEEIALGLSGVPVPGGSWEVNVGYVEVSGISDPTSLPADLYLVRLRNSGGRLAWHLSGSLGTETDLPVVMSEDHRPSGGFGEITLLSSGGSIRLTRRSGETGEPPSDLVLLDWPGRWKPAMRFRLLGVSAAATDPVAERMRENGLDQLGLSQDIAHSGVLYLDPERRHRLVTVWDFMTAGRTADILRSGEQGAFSQRIGVILTDVAWDEPALPAGTYIVWWNKSVGGIPYFEVSVPGGNRRFPLPTKPSHGPPSGAGAGLGSALASPGGNGSSGMLTFGNMGSVDKYFRFRILIRPVKPDGSLSDKTPWGEGWFSLKRP